VKQSEQLSKRRASLDDYLSFKNSTVAALPELLQRDSIQLSIRIPDRPCSFIENAGPSLALRNTGNSNPGLRVRKKCNLTGTLGICEQRMAAEALNGR
jgi:hypothetical protein